MFIDYLKLTYLIQKHDQPLDSGQHWAEFIMKRVNVQKEEKIDGAHRIKFHDVPEGTRVVMDFGGSECPVDLDDFLRKFKNYRGWTISRMDLAENITHVTRGQVRKGQSKKFHHYEEAATVNGKTVSVWTGTSLGKRGKAGSYFRVYDARKHVEGRAAKIVRFGTYDFWRAEYELSREYFRRNNITTLGDMSVELLNDIWENETKKKGVLIQGTSHYREIKQWQTIQEVEEEMKQESRLLTVLKMVKKMDEKRLSRLGYEIAVQKFILVYGQSDFEYLLDPTEKLNDIEVQEQLIVNRIKERFADDIPF